MGLSTKRKLACFLPQVFKPEGTARVVRLGSDNKGGHVVAADAVASTRNLLSLGLAPNFDFEIDFAAMAPLHTLHGYDPAIDEEAIRRARRRALIPFFGSGAQRRRAMARYRDYKALFADKGKGFVHRRQAVGLDDGMIGLEEAIAGLRSEPGQTFIKCDIGGGEYDMLDVIIENNALLSGVALVLHHVPAHMREIRVFLMAMREFMALDNMTADNSAGLDRDNVPMSVALSMSAKSSEDPHIPIAGATTRYQILNEPNDPGKIELEIFYVD